MSLDWRPSVFYFFMFFFFFQLLCVVKGKKKNRGTRKIDFIYAIATGRELHRDQSVSWSGFILDFSGKELDKSLVGRLRVRIIFVRGGTSGEHQMFISVSLVFGETVQLIVYEVKSEFGGSVSGLVIGKQSGGSSVSSHPEKRGSLPLSGSLGAISPPLSPLRFTPSTWGFGVRNINTSIPLQPVLGHSGAQKWLRSSGSWSR